MLKYPTRTGIKLFINNQLLSIKHLCLALLECLGFKFDFFGEFLNLVHLLLKINSPTRHHFVLLLEEVQLFSNLFRFLFKLNHILRILFFSLLKALLLVLLHLLKFSSQDLQELASLLGLDFDISGLLFVSLSLALKLRLQILNLLKKLVFLAVISSTDFFQFSTLCLFFSESCLELLQFKLTSLGVWINALAADSLVLGRIIPARSSRFSRSFFFFLLLGRRRLLCRCI